jgi:hypothetical protein
MLDAQTESPKSWLKYYNFDAEPKSDVDTRLDKGGKPTKAFWTLWHRIKILFEDLNQKIAAGWLVFDEDNNIINNLVINEEKLILGAVGDNVDSCTVYYGWEWVEGDETLAHYKAVFGKWKMIPPKAWQEITL